MSRRDAFAPLRDWHERDEHLVVGLMTGTSADGVDAVLVRLRGRGLGADPKLLACREAPFDAELRREVLAIAGADRVELERVMRLDVALAERYAEVVAELLSSAGVKASEVGAIGSHGQTIRHIPRREGDGRALSLQIGSASTLAERTGIAVVSDFRPRDTAAGGEGAPLVPIADWWLFRSAQESRVLLNLGGMANVTLLSKGAPLDQVVAFDTGPGNAVLDGLVGEVTGGLARHDEGGRMAAEGRVSSTVLQELLADPFFTSPPPRSTGRERFGAAYVHRLRDIGDALELSIEDMLATAVELTAVSIAEAIRHHLVPRGGVDVVYVSGGGVRNVTLMLAIRRHLEAFRVERLDELGVPSDSKEALAFALLAHLTLSGLAGNVPSATGARFAVPLGHVTPAGLKP